MASTPTAGCHALDIKLAYDLSYRWAREGAIGFLARERTVAGPGFNRWLIPPAALLAHLSIGEIYAFSVFKNPLVERFRTGLTPIAIIFSISIVLWALVLIPLLWGIYQTLTDVVALFA